jgi:2'-5' RNA ligase
MQPTIGAETQRLRCFVAMGIGDDIRESVERMVADLRAGMTDGRPRLSWTRPQGWHVTLKFLGDVEAARIDEIGARLSEAVVDTAPFAIRATGVSTLPAGVRRARVIVVDLKDEGGSMRLATAVDEALEPLGFEREQRRFVAHLTVARVRSNDGWPRFGERLDRWRDSDLGTSIVDAVGLYRSRLGSGGSRYSLLRRFDLNATRAVHAAAGDQ